MKESTGHVARVGEMWYICSIWAVTSVREELLAKKQA